MGTNGNKGKRERGESKLNAEEKNTVRVCGRYIVAIKCECELNDNF